MKRVFDKLLEAVIYYIVMYILISVMINERYRAPLYKMSGWGIFAATRFTMIKLLLGGDDAPFANSLNKLTILVFILFGICFAGAMTFNSFGEVLLRIVGK